MAQQKIEALLKKAGINPDTLPPGLSLAFGQSACGAPVIHIVASIAQIDGRTTAGARTEAKLLKEIGDALVANGAQRLPHSSAQRPAPLRPEPNFTPSDGPRYRDLVRPVIA